MTSFSVLTFIKNCHSCCPFLIYSRVQFRVGCTMTCSHVPFSASGAPPVGQTCCNEVFLSLVSLFLHCPGPWVPGWAPCAVHYFHKAANTDCRGRNCFYRGHWEFSVVVLEFDSLSHWFPEKIKICEFCH